MMNKNKKGISPLIATVIIIGLTIVLAALVVTFGTNLVKKTTDETEKTSTISTACSDVALKLNLKSTLLNGTVNVNVDNSGSKKFEGLMFRVYNVGETPVDSYDTDVASDKGTKIVTTDNDYTVSPNLVKTFTLTLTSVTTPVKVGVKPKINILGKTEVCGETKTEI